MSKNEQMSESELEAFFLLKYGSIENAYENWRNSPIKVLEMEGWSDVENKYLFDFAVMRLLIN